jgi:hypothetical protein
MHNLNSTYALGWCNTDDGTAGNQDVSLRRDDAKILAVRSDKPNTDHTLRVYNNYKSSTDFERAAVGWTTTVNVLTIGSQNAGTGVARDVHLVAGNNRVALLNQNYLQIDKILKLPVQSAPSSPQDGDIWRQDNTVTGLKIRVAGATRTITVT